MTATEYDMELLMGTELKHGSHASPGDGACAMELASLLAKEPWSDHPQCVCPVVGSAFRRANDEMPADLRNELLKLLVPLALGTRSTRSVELKRMYMAADWAVRWAAPMALRARGRADLAEKLEKLPQVVDRATAGAARDAAKEVRASDAYASYAASAASHAASYAASAYGAGAGAASASSSSYAAAAAYASDAASSASAASSYAAYADYAYADYADAAYAYAADASAAASSAASSARRTIWTSFCNLLKDMCAVTE